MTNDVCGLTLKQLKVVVINFVIIRTFSCLYYLLILVLALIK